jgi:iron complex outermembrane receptor protein
LLPEKARTFSAGLDWTPPFAAGFKADLTYYLVRYDERITVPNGIGGVLNVLALEDESILGPAIVTRNPSSSLIQQYVSNPAYVNPFGVNSTTITALADYRTRNLSSQRTNGIDFELSYNAKSAFVDAETGLDGTKIFELKNQFSSSTPYISLLNTTFNPVDLRLRAREVLTRGPTTLAVFMNYTNSYTNNIVPPAHVSSWTTIDVTATYRVLRDLSVSVGALNIANRNPPFVLSDSGAGLDYDGANANPLGRFLYAQLQMYF